MRHVSDFPKKVPLRESCDAEQRVFKCLRGILFRVEPLFSGKSLRRGLADSLVPDYKGFLLISV
jgi:hypothetical protein